MGFIDALRRLFGGASSPSGTGSSDAYGIWFHFRCNRCGATVRVRADRRNDLNREDDGPGPLVLRKDVMDDRCFQLMYSEIWLDERYQVVSAEVTGGKLITQQEYEAAAQGASGEASSDEAANKDTSPID
jgi:hypothetical protein